MAWKKEGRGVRWFQEENPRNSPEEADDTVTDSSEAGTWLVLCCAHKDFF